jgi:hypothetical protein
LDNGNSIIIPRNTDSLTVAFAKHLGGRHSCSSCAFKLGSHKQYADISIGDFWGCENNAPNSFEPQGVSAVLTYTDKGNAFLHSLTSAMKIDAVDSVDIYKGNPGACKPCQRNINSDRFLDDILRKSMPFDKLVSKYAYGMKYGRDYSGLNLKIGIWGSFNLRASVLDACQASESKLVFQYSNSSLISQMSSPAEVGDITMPKNPFRSCMLKNDFDKTAVRDDNILSLGNIDYLVIDFLEERFDICKVGSSLITVSDALMDTDYKADSIGFDIELWKEKSLMFIEHLVERGFVGRIILVEIYLAIYYKNKAGESILFSEEDFHNIDEINERLSICYDFFREKCPACHFIQTEQALCYCQNAHRHGMYPWHLNDEYYDAVSKKLLEVLVEEQ